MWCVRAVVARLRAPMVLVGLGVAVRGLHWLGTRLVRRLTAWELWLSLAGGMGAMRMRLVVVRETDKAPPQRPAGVGVGRGRLRPHKDMAGQGERVR